MGDGVKPEWEKPEPDAQPSPRTHSQIFHEAFPHYLQMGMSPEAYWDGESWLVRDYREAYRIQKTLEYRERDEIAWQNGMYMRLALQSVYLMVNGFVPKGAHTEQYPEKPFSVQEEERRKEEARAKQAEQKKREEEEKMKGTVALFQALTGKINRNLAKKQLEEKLRSIPGAYRT